MSDVTFTPGPWKRCTLEPNTLGHEWVDADQGRQIAFCGGLLKPTVHGMIGRPELEEIEANTCLIAAAPELLELLKEIVADSDDVDDGLLPSVSSATLTRARAVIAKAEPKQLNAMLEG